MFCVAGMIIMLSTLVESSLTSRSVSPDMTALQIQLVFNSTSPGDVIAFSGGTFTTACDLALFSSHATITGAGQQETVLDCSLQGKRHLHLLGKGIRVRDLHFVGGSSDCVPSNSSYCGSCQCGHSAPSGGNGGCILISSAEALISNAAFSRCVATWHGGAISLASDSNLQLEGVTIADCEAGGSGGGVFLEGNANVTVQGNARFHNNTAASDGGAISANAGHVLVRNGVRFLHNMALNGGAIAGTDSEMAIWQDITFEENEASGLGGAVMGSDSALAISQGVRLHRNVALRGGAISLTRGMVTVSNDVNITENSCPSSGGRGGGLYLDGAEADLTGSVLLHGNTASWYGGGWAQYNGGATRASAGVEISDNSCQASGGAVYGFNGGSVVLEGGVRVRGNGARRGGAVYVSRLEALTLQDDVLLEGNTASITGCAVYANSVTVSAVNGVVARNSACGDAGFLYTRSGTVTLHGVRVTDMTVVDGWGGAVYVDNWTTLLVSNSQILRCFAFHGGGVAVKSNSEATFEGDVLIADNVASHNGGAIYSWIKIAVTLQGPGVLLRNNSGRGWGGGIYVQEDSTLRVLDGATVQDSGHFWSEDWSDPATHGIGGAIHAVRNALVVLDGARILNNVARSGGAVDLDDHAVLRVTNSRIEGNGAVDKGGAVYAYQGSSVELLGGTEVVGNSADSGGALAAAENAVAVLDACSVLNNTARSRGGAVSMAGNAHVNIRAGAVLNGNRVTASRSDCEQPPCGGGAVQVGGVGTAVIGGGAVIEGNKADVGGGVLVMDSASATVQTVVQGNAAVDGGGMAALNESVLSLQGAVCSQNSAQGRGGCLFHSGQAVEVEGWTRMEGNEALHGGAMFMFSGGEMLGSAGAETLLRGNQAGQQGGAMQLEGSQALLRVHASHRVVLEDNTAGTNGGAVAMSFGASVLVSEDKCPAYCSSSIRGDGICHPECLTAECNWDEGDCNDVMRSAGEDGQEACLRDDDGCTEFRQFAECHPACWNAACDWHRLTCQPEKTRMRACPLYDATVFASVRKHSLVYVRGGNAGGYGRCNSTCEAPDTVQTDLTWVAGAVGSSAVQFGGDDAWVVVHDATRLDRAVSAVTLDAWVKVDASMQQRGFVVSWEHLGLFVLPFGDQGFAFGIEAGSSVSASGNWRQCVDGSVTTVTDAFGLLTDGVADYNANLVCTFIIAPDRSALGCEELELVLTFHELETEDGWDWIYVSDCLDAACTTKTPVADQPFSGSMDSFSRVSATGIMEVSFLPDQSINSRGFVATFDARPSPDSSAFPGVFAAGSWHHVSAAVAADGTTQYQLDGDAVHPAPSAPMYAMPLVGGFSLGQRFLGPELEQGGRLHGSVDDLRVWEGVHETASDRASGCADSSVLSRPGLLLCFALDEGSGALVLNSAPSGAEQGQGVVGEKHLPWCVTKNDEGLRILPWYSGNNIELGVSWGFCSTEKPRLPGSSFEYDAAEMETVSGMRSLAQLLASYPSCGGHPLHFARNRALGGNGGAVFQGDCDSAADAKGLCFFTGLTSGGAGTIMASYSDNSASGAGGAAYLECNALPTHCLRSMAVQLPWPLSDDVQLQVRLEGNSAQTRVGADAQHIATGPNNILLPTDDNATRWLGDWPAPMQRAYVPGQSLLNISLALLDDMGSLVVSSLTVPNSWYVEVLLCAVHGPCDATSALSSPTLLRFSREDGDPMARTMESEQLVVCAVGEDRVRVHLSLVGALVPPRTVNVSCLPCEAGESQQEVAGNGAVQVWTCTSCAPTEYVVDPNLHPCQPCPDGLRCFGTAVVEPRVANSSWRAVDGEYRLEACPVGYLLVNGSGQFCKQCEPLTYSFDPFDGCSDGVCAVRECLRCPLGARCLGERHFEPEVAGSQWALVRDNNHVMKRLRECPPGYILVQSPTNSLVDDCVQCKAGKYSVLPAQLEPPDYTSGSLVVQQAEDAINLCRPCPNGAECDGGDNVSPKEGYWMVAPDERRRGGADNTNNTALLTRARREEEAIQNEGLVNVYLCPARACESGGVCADGREGPLCGLCKEGWALSGTECSECRGVALSSYQYIGLGVVIPVFIVLWYYISWGPFFSKGEEESEHEGSTEEGVEDEVEKQSASLVGRAQAKAKQAAARVIEYNLIDYIKVIISFFQLASTFETTYRIQWPESLKQVWKLGAVFRMNLLDVPGASCVAATWDYFTLLQAYTVSALLVAFLLWVPSLLVILMGQHYSNLYKRVSDRFWFTFLFWIFLIYPLLAVITVQPFYCKEIEGVRLLNAELRVECPLDDLLSPLFVYAIVSTLIFPVGIPVVILAVLYHARVPAMAKKKETDALFSQMTSMYLHVTGKAVSSKLDAYVHGIQHLKNCTEKEVFAPIFRRYGLDDGSGITLDGFMHFLEKQRIEIKTKGEVEEIEILFNKHDAHKTGAIPLPAFERFMRDLLDLYCAINPSCTRDDVEEFELEALVRLKWADHVIDDDTETSAVQRTLKKHLSKRSRAKDQLERDRFLCKLPLSAPREEKMEWLLATATRMKHQGAIALPLLKWEGATPHERHALDRFGFLFESYEVQYWYYEVLEMLRKFIMTGVIVFFYPESPAQLASGFVVSIIAFILMLKTEPFVSPTIDKMQAISLMTQSATLFYGLMYSVQNLSEGDAAAEDTSADRALVYMLAFLHALIFFLPVVFVLLNPGFRDKLLQKCLRGWRSFVAFVSRKPKEEPVEPEEVLSQASWRLKKPQSVHRTTSADLDLDRVGSTSKHTNRSVLADTVDKYPADYAPWKKTAHHPTRAATVTGDVVLQTSDGAGVGLPRHGAVGGSGWQHAPPNGLVLQSHAVVTVISADDDDELSAKPDVHKTANGHASEPSGNGHARRGQSVKTEELLGPLSPVRRRSGPEFNAPLLGRERLSQAEDDSGASAMLTQSQATGSPGPLPQDQKHSNSGHRDTLKGDSDPSQIFIA